MRDLTSLWAFWQTHKDKILSVVIGILLFGAGWQLGRVMSPYYAAHPIVFESEGKAPANLKSLSPSAHPTATPAVAGANNKTGAFVGSVNSDLYHDPSCPSAGRIKAENQVWFSSPEEAAQMGYSPSQCTTKLLGL